MLRKFLPPDIQKLVKAGYISSQDLELSQNGIRALHALLFDEYKTALLKMADEEILENEKPGRYV